MKETNYRDLVKSIKKIKPNWTKLNVALLGDSSTQYLKKAISGYAATKQLNLVVKEADYDQIDQIIYFKDSFLYNNEYDFISIFKSSVKLAKKYDILQADQRLSFADNLISDYKSYIEILSSNSKAKIIIFNFAETTDLVFNNYACKIEFSWLYQLRKANFYLMKLIRDYPNVYMCDLSSINNRLGERLSFDNQRFFTSDLVTSFSSLPTIARSFSNIVLASIGRFNKCLILDLDNTLWGGVIGDDGIENIQIGSTGIGKIFQGIQQWAKSLKERGIILTVCSKNTEIVAKEPFQKHNEMILKLDDIAVFVANWENKADNIRHIQAILNIGFDSMVFIDDNPFERNFVKTEIPEITVPSLPTDPANYLTFLQNLYLFETTSYTGIDSKRTQQYLQEQKRTEVFKKFNSIDKYLAQLEMQANVKPFSNIDIPRIAQLTQRSNQFNLRTIRYDEEEIHKIQKSKNHLHFAISLQDKFGNYGLVSIIIIEILDVERVFINTWIMSCRVLKRGLEHFVLNEIVARVLLLGFKKVIGERIPTKKNELVKDHYKNLGFIHEDEFWVLDLAKFEKKQNFISKLERSAKS